MDYTKDSEIDSTALDVEWLNQAALAIKYGEYWSNCEDTLNRAEENVKIVRSEVIIELMNDPDTYLSKGVKPTGPVIEAYYRTHKKHKKAKEGWLEAKHESDMAEIAKKEIGVTRKAALTNLVELHGQSYFAGPSVPRDLSYQAQQKEMQKRKDSKISKKLKRSK